MVESHTVSKQQVVIILCRIGALGLIIWLVLRWALTLAGYFYFQTLDQGSDGFQINPLGYLANFGIDLVAYGGLATILWLAAGWIAARMLPASPPAGPVPSFSIVDLQAVALSAIGMFFLIAGLLDTISSVKLQAVVLPESSTIVNEVGFQKALAAGVSRSLLGLIVLLGARPLARGLQSIAGEERTAPTPKREEP